MNTAAARQPKCHYVLSNRPTLEPRQCQQFLAPLIDWAVVASLRSSWHHRGAAAPWPSCYCQSAEAAAERAFLRGVTLASLGCAAC